MKIDLEDESFGRDATAAEMVLNSPLVEEPARTTIAPEGGEVRDAASAASQKMTSTETRIVIKPILEEEKLRGLWGGKYPKYGSSYRFPSLIFGEKSTRVIRIEFGDDVTHRHARPQRFKSGPAKKSQISNSSIRVTILLLVHGWRRRA